MTAATPVRLARPEDFPELLRVTNLAYRVEDFFIHGDRLSMLLLEQYAARPGGAFLVVDGTTRGTLAGSVYFEVRADRGWFGLLAVDPALQGQGLARALIEAMEARCRSVALPWLELEVVDLRAELPAFYARFGFEVTGRHPFPDGAKLKRPAEMIVMGKAIGGP